MCSCPPAFLSGWLASYQQMHAGIWGWNNVMSWGKKVGGKGLRDLLELGVERKERLQ